MRMIRRIWGAAAALVLAAASACSDDTALGPLAGGLAGQWYLTSMDGCPLTSTTCDNRSNVIAGTLDFGLDGSVRRVVTYRGTGPAPLVWRETGTAHMVGDTSVQLRVFDETGNGPRILVGELNGINMRIRYPHPADGEAVEIWTWRTVIN